MNIKNKIKFKFINYLLISGKKETCESILLKSFKELQKKSIKSHNKIAKLAVKNSALAFRINKLKKKTGKNKSVREIPVFISDNYERISWSLNYILKTSKKKHKNKFYQILPVEFLLNSQNKGDAIKIKTELYKQISLKKRLFLYFRW